MVLGMSGVVVRRVPVDSTCPFRVSKVNGAIVPPLGVISLRVLSTSPSLGLRRMMKWESGESTIRSHPEHFRTLKGLGLPALGKKGQNVVPFLPFSLFSESR